VTLASSLKRPTSGRKRRVAGWSLVSIGLVFASVTFAMRWYEWRQEWNDTWIWFEGGTAGLGWSQAMQSNRRLTGYWPPKGLFKAERPLSWKLDDKDPPAAFDIGVFRLITWTDSTQGQFRAWRARVLLWPFGLSFLIAGASFVVNGRWARKLAQAGSCPACGYNLNGLPPATPCPECGSRARRASEGEAE
jgi:hypothetical protein